MRQGDPGFKPSLGNLVRPHLKKCVSRLHPPDVLRRKIRLGRSMKKAKAPELRVGERTLGTVVSNTGDQGSNHSRSQHHIRFGICN